MMRRLFDDRQAEIDRLKDGRLTKEEFNALCHHLHERGTPCSRDEFNANCVRFQDRLFGPRPADDPLEPLREFLDNDFDAARRFALMHEWAGRARTRPESRERDLYHLVACLWIGFTNLAGQALKADHE